MTSDLKEIKQEEWIKLRETILTGGKISAAEISFLAAMMAKTGAPITDTMISSLIDSSLGDSLADNPAVMGIIDAVIEAFDEANPNPIVELKNAGDKTIVLGDVINAVVKGSSGKEHPAKVLTSVDRVITGNKKILAIRDKLIAGGQSQAQVNPIQCIFETGDFDLVADVIFSALSTDIFKENVSFESSQDLMQSLGDTKGFVVCTPTATDSDDSDTVVDVAASHRYTGIYEAYDIEKQESVLATLTTSTEKKEVCITESTILLLLFN